MLKRLLISMCVLLGFLVQTPLSAQMVTVNPVEASGAFGNPLMGFRNDLDSYQSYPYVTVVRQYIKWNEIENSQSDTVQKIREFCNTKWANLPANNVKVIPRVYIDWDSKPGNENWPADLQTGDWTSQEFKDRVVRLIGRLGEVWDKDPRVAWVQTGIIGYWGEQENPVGVDEDGWAVRLGNAYTNAFPNKKLIVRNMSHWPGYNVGTYWDSFGHPSQAGVRNTIKSFNNQGCYRSQIIEGEVAYDWGQDTFDPVYGGEPEITLNDPTYTDNMIDVIRELHGSALGWISSYKLDGRNGTDPTKVRENAAKMQREFGYRFHITEFLSSARTEPGANLNVQFKVKNNGSAPMYENWPVAVTLINETTRQIVWKATLPTIDIRTWLPGENYSSSSRSYQIPALEHPYSASLPLPAGIAPGQYLIGLSILEPLSRTPGVFFSVPNFFKESQSQPLCRIGIGAKASGHTLTGVSFDSMVNNDDRFYTLIAQGQSHSLTVQSSGNGAISTQPGGGSYIKDTGVQVRASGKLGYAFSSWGGALAGNTTNPALVVMDVNKTITANYTPVPTYTITTSTTNGYVTLNPPGGTYNTGTVVTLTAVPDRGYRFNSWSGALLGSTGSMTLTMNESKSVVANFSAFNGDIAPGTETFFKVDGTKVNGAPTTWMATRPSGKFEVNGNRLMVNQGGDEGVFETANMSISGGTVKVSLEVQSVGALESMDYVKFYKIIDGGEKIQIGSSISGATSGVIILNEAAISGNSLKLRIETRVSAADEFYYLDNLKVEEDQPPSYTLSAQAINGSVSLNPPGGSYPKGTLVAVTAIPDSGFVFSHWSGGLNGQSRSATVTLNSDKSVIANFIIREPSSSSILLVVGDANNVGTSDQLIGQRLVTLGYTVQLMSDEVVTAADSVGKVLVLTSSSVGSSVLGSKLRDIAVPVINWETFVQDDFGFVLNAGNTVSQTSLDIVNPTHPLAGGLAMGVQAVANSSGDFSWGFPLGSPIIIARLNDTTRSPCLYAYEAGAAMSVGVAPARRVHLFLQGNTFGALNDNGLKLFDAAAAWALGVVFPSWSKQTVVEGDQMKIEWVGGGMLQTSTNLKDWFDLTDATSPHVAVMQGNSMFFRVKKKRLDLPTSISSK